jgi:methyl-accepting chemotaxis protein
MLSLRNISIANRIHFALGAVVLACGAAVVFATLSLSQVTRSFSRFLEHDLTFTAALSEMYAQGLQQGQALRNITLDPKNRKAYDNFAQAGKDFDAALTAAKDLAANDPSSTAAVADIATLRAKQKPIQARVIAAVEGGSGGAVAVINAEETPTWRDLKAKLLDLRKLKDGEAAGKRDELAAFRMHAIYVGITGAAGAVLGFLLALGISRSIVRPLRHAVVAADAVAAGDLTQAIQAEGRDETAQLLQSLGRMNAQLRDVIGKIRVASESVSIASGEIASGNADLAQRTSAQAGSVDQTASSMEELTSTVKQNADNAKQANQLAASASAVAVRGGAVVGEVVSTMNGINDSSKKIADIIGVIDGIAFQTNILALNAAVEAARAGEQGRGFAVVASEVRGLAQRSAAAAKEIKDLIEDSVHKTEAGAVLVSRAGTTMDEVVASVKRVTDIMAEITSATIEQSAGIELVNQAIAQMDSTTQQNAALVEQEAAATKSLDEQARQLASAVAVFKVSGHDAAAPVVAAQPAPNRTDRRSPVRARNVTRPQFGAKTPSALPAPTGQGTPRKTGTDDEWAEF